MEWALDNLTKAEQWTTNLTNHLNSQIDKNVVKKNASDLEKAVKNASDLAVALQKAIEETGKAEKALDSEELKKVFSGTLKEVEDLSTQLKTLKPTADGINTMAQEVDKKQDELKQELVKAKPLLEKAVQTATKAKKTVKEEGKKALNDKMNSQDKKENGSDSLVGNKENEAGGIVKDGPKLPTDEHDSTTHNPQATGNDKLSPGGQHKNESTSSSTHGGDTPDGAYGGAIATCTAAPLLLLLTAVAYAAVC